MKTVWRLENKDGNGPYIPGPGERLKAVMRDLHASHKNMTHPSPFVDNIRNFDWTNEFCGFRTRRDLEEWFDGFMPRLYRAGFRMVRYDIPADRVRNGTRQVVFKRGRCRPRQIIETLP